MIDVDRGPRPPELDKGHGSDAFKVVLHARFLGKCYLTESVIPASEMDVEHRIPRSAGGGVDDWENLYPARPKANAHRRRTVPDGGWASPGEQVERRLVQQLTSGVELRCVFAAVDSADRSARNTAEELTRLHHEISGERTDWSRDLRDAIHRAYTGLLEDHFRWTSASEAAEKAACEAMVALRLSRRAPYTALLRSTGVGKFHRDRWD
jgi:hypothetical protein